VNFITAARGWGYAGHSSEDALHRVHGFEGSGLRISELREDRAGADVDQAHGAGDGGKDGIVVDEEADIDAAVEGTVQAAFGYQGQKCSACSRAIVSEKIYDTFVDKLVERTKKITVGPSDNPTITWARWSASRR